MALDDPSAEVTAFWRRTEKPFQEPDVRSAREADERGGEDISGPAPGRVIEFEIDDSVRIPCRHLLPQHGVQNALLWLWFHGGGWVVGSVNREEPIARYLCERIGPAVLLAGYRRAPERPFPHAVRGATERCQRVLRNKVPHIDDYLPLIAGGDSAGGNLAAVRGWDPDRPSYMAPENQLILNRETVIWFWDHHSRHQVDRRSPLAAPLRTGDLASCSRAIVLTAEHDVLGDEVETSSRRLASAGGDVHFRWFTGQLHGFFTTPGVLPASLEAVDFAAKYVKELLAKSGPDANE